MRSARIRTAWKNKTREVSIEEHAVAAAAIAWRVAVNAAKNLHQQKFVYEDDAERLGVMREYLYFFIHAADRQIAKHLDDDSRARFITNLSHECRRHYAENARDIVAGDASSDKFIDELNARMNDYATTKFNDDEPGFESYRALGLRVEECLLQEAWANKWTQDQVLNVDGPEAFRIFNRALTALNKSARV